MSVASDIPSPPASVPLSSYTRVLRRRWKTVTVLLLGCILGAVAWIVVGPKSYTSTANVTVKPIVSSPFESNLSPSLVDPTTEESVVTSTSVAALAAKIMHTSDSPSELLQNVSVTVPANANDLQISYKADTQSGAVAGANAFANAYLQYRAAQAKSQVQAILNQISTSVQSLLKQISAVNNTIASSSPSSAGAQNGLLLRQVLTQQLTTLTGYQNQLTSMAIVPGALVSPAMSGLPTTKPTISKTIILGLGLLVGLILGLLVAFIRQRTDKRMHDAHDVFGETGAEPLAVLSRRVGRGRTPVAALESPRSAEAGAYRVLHTKMDALHEDLRTVLVIGSAPGDPAADVAANLAVMQSTAGHPTTLALPTPALVAQLSGAFAADRPRMSDGAAASLSSQPSSTRVQLLGPVGAEMPLERDRVRELLAGLLSDGDSRVVIAAPADRAALLALAAAVDGVLVVVNRRQTRRDALDDLLDDLYRVQARLIGCVLTVRGGKAKRRRGRSATAPATADRPTTVRTIPAVPANRAASAPGELVGRAEGPARAGQPNPGSG